MVTTQTAQIWNPKRLNQSGIRRLKIVDADLMDLSDKNDLVPQVNAILYEFIFPSDLSCTATIQRQKKESTGAVWWDQSVSFSLPHISNSIVMWAANNDETLWLAIAEDYNGITRLYGTPGDGLTMSFGATTGSGPRSSNPMNFSFEAEQLLPFIELPSYEDNILFPSKAAFSYGFSTGFNS